VRYSRTELGDRLLILQPPRKRSTNAVLKVRLGGSRISPRLTMRWSHNSLAALPVTGFRPTRIEATDRSSFAQRRSRGLEYVRIR
jgi:hypothetical protein